MTSESFSANLATAREHAALGTPLPPDGPRRALKRLVLRVNGVFLRHQVAVNASLVHAVAELAEDVAASTRVMSDELAALRGWLERLQHGYHDLDRRIEEVGAETARVLVDARAEEIRLLASFKSELMDRLDLALRQIYAEVADATSHVTSEHTRLSLEAATAHSELRAVASAAQTLERRLAGLESKLERGSGELRAVKSDAVGNRSGEADARRP